jgi:hypothetical protein
LNTPEDWVILYLAHFNHRYDRELFCALLDLTKEEIVSIEENLNKYNFMRRSIIKENEFLHEDMQNLLNEFAWPSIDSKHELRKRITKVAIDKYYDPKIEITLSILKEFSLNRSSFGSMISAWDIFLTLVELEVEKIDYIYKNYLKDDYDMINEVKNQISIVANKFIPLIHEQHIKSVYQNSLINLGYELNL